jgi:hypothetical protein
MKRPTDEISSTPDIETAANAPVTNEAENDAENVSRRGFLRGLGGSLAATALGGVALTTRPDGTPAEAEAATPAAGGPAVATGKAPVSLTVNGKKHTVAVDPRRTLLDMLRNDLDLTGPNWSAITARAAPARFCWTVAPCTPA